MTGISLPRQATLTRSSSTFVLTLSVSFLAERVINLSNSLPADGIDALVSVKVFCKLHRSLFSCAVTCCGCFSFLIAYFIFMLVSFLRATAGTAIARLSHRNSVCPSVRLSVTRVDQAKTVQPRIIKSSLSAAPKTLVSGSVTLVQKCHRGHPNRGP